MARPSEQPKRKPVPRGAPPPPRPLPSRRASYGPPPRTMPRQAPLHRNHTRRGKR